jgi:hypothetical protein
MKEALIVNVGLDVSPGVIAVLSGEAGRVQRRVEQGLAGAVVLTLDAARRVWQSVRVRARVGVASNAHLSIASSRCEDQVSWEVAPVAHFY